MTEITASPLNTSESTAVNRQREILKRQKLKEKSRIREGLRVTDGSYILEREVIKHCYALGIVEKLHSPIAQLGMKKEDITLANIIAKANYPANTERLTLLGEENPGGVDGETLALLQGMGILDDIPTDIDVLIDSSSDPSNKFARLRNFPRDEQLSAQKELELKVKVLGILMFLRDVASDKSLRSVEAHIDRLGPNQAQRILENLQEKGFVALRSLYSGPVKEITSWTIDQILLSPEEARQKFFKLLHENANIKLGPDVTFIPPSLG